MINGDTFFDINYNNLINTNINKFYGCIALTKRTNYKYNNKIINLRIDKNNILKFSNIKTNLMNGGVYLFNKKIFKFIKNEYLSLENDILNKILLKKKN